MCSKCIERLVGKFFSVHIVVPGAVAHIYCLQRSLYQLGVDRSWLSPYFHCEIADYIFNNTRVMDYVITCDNTEYSSHALHEVVGGKHNNDWVLITRYRTSK